MSATTSSKPETQVAKATVNAAIRERPRVREIAEDVPEHVSELAIGALAASGFADFAIAEATGEELAKLGNSVASQMAERAAEVDAVVPQVLECNSRLLSDRSLRNLKKPLSRLGQQCLDRAPTPPKLRIAPGEDRTQFLTKLVAQSLTIAERLDHACNALHERGFVGHIRHNGQRTVAEITSGHTVTTDRKLSKREERRDAPVQKQTGWYITKETTKTRVTTVYEIETIEIHVTQRHLLLQAEHYDIRCNIERPAHVQKLCAGLPDWLAYELTLSTGHLHNYQVQQEKLRQYNHEVEESTIETRIRRRLNDRGRDRDLFFNSMVLGGMVGGPLAAILAGLTLGPIGAAVAGSAVAATGLVGATVLDPAISWGPHCLCSWLPKGMVPQQISSGGTSR